jgi:hypothetical protein
LNGWLILTGVACDVAPKVVSAFAWGSALLFGKGDDCSTPSMGVDDGDNYSELLEEVMLG